MSFVAAITISNVLHFKCRKDFPCNRTLKNFISRSNGFAFILNLLTLMLNKHWDEDEMVKYTVDLWLY